jgi:nucleoside-diphosphate-sugar epimerase
VPESPLRRILITGAAGRIGTAFYSDARGQYEFRLTDSNPAILDRQLEATDAADVVDITDADQVGDACQDIDTVIHLAADPSPEAGFHESLLANNFVGTYNVFRAAADAGCRRIIFASSVHAVLGHPHGKPVRELDPVWPINMYGVSKCFGEATARKFSSTEGLSSIAIRIGAYEAPWLAEHPDPENLMMFLSARDMNHLLHCCIEVADLPFAILHGVSNNREKRLSIDETRRQVGYDPVDDGFSLYGETG